jgi:hypothetical protein
MDGLKIILKPVHKTAFPNIFIVLYCMLYLYLKYKYQ